MFFLKKEISYLLLFFLSGCMVGPKYQKPDIQLPQKYSENKNSTSSADLLHWWTFFNDPILSNLIEEAIIHNYDLQIAMEKIFQSRAVYMIAKANLYPEIDAFGAINRSHASQNLSSDSLVNLQNSDSCNTTQDSSSTTETQTTKNQSFFQAGFDTIWELDFWGKLRHRRRGAYYEYQAQTERTKDVYLILVADIAKSYIESRTLEKKIALLKEQLKIDLRLIDLLHDRFISGIDSEIPLLDQQEILNESKNQLIILETAYKQTIISIALLLGKNPEEFILTPKICKVPQSTKTLKAGLPSELLRRRPDIAEAERLLAAATEYVGEAIAQWFPSFSLLGYVDFESNKASTWFSHKSLAWSIGPSVRWPIITFGRISYLVKEKKSIQRQALLTYSKTIVNALGDVENSFIAYFNGEKQIKTIEKKLETATQKTTLTKDLFAHGLASEIDLLYIEKNRINTELELTDTQQIVSSALVSVYKALGGEW
ncbi:MAG TPA: efflux transporter outer membrane subunit [Candidatus Babeliales bacterium]|nr:efflux transporter outer membrane subunit [Candidatus Babeliales bacterium]